MYTRLAFAVAAHLDPDILIVDEVLSVGDAAFQKRCLGKMESVRESGRTVLFVSHNMTAVGQLCTRCIWIDKGKIQSDGETRETIHQYLGQAEPTRHRIAWSPQDAPGDERVRLLAAEIVDGQGQPTGCVAINKAVSVKLTFQVAADNAAVLPGVQILNDNGIVAFVSHASQSVEWCDKSYAKGTYCAVCSIPADLLNTGRLYVNVLLVNGKDRSRNHVFHERAVSFESYDPGTAGLVYHGKYGGVVRPILAWKIQRTH